MSATQDKTQKISFVYSNLYQLYRKGKEAASQAQVPSESPLAVPARDSQIPHVLKTGDLKADALRIETFKPTEFIQKRVSSKPEVLAPTRPGQAEAVASLKKNLNSLNELHSRLRFMLQELEDLVKD